MWVFFLSKEFYLEYEVLTFPRNADLLFLQLKSRGAQLLLRRIESHFIQTWPQRNENSSHLELVPRQRKAVGSQGLRIKKEKACVHVYICPYK